MIGLRRGNSRVNRSKWSLQFRLSVTGEHGYASAWPLVKPETRRGRVGGVKRGGVRVRAGGAVRTPWAGPCKSTPDQGASRYRVAPTSPGASSLSESRLPGPLRQENGLGGGSLENFRLGLCPADRPDDVKPNVANSFQAEFSQFFHSSITCAQLQELELAAFRDGFGMKVNDPSSHLKDRRSAFRPPPKEPASPRQSEPLRGDACPLRTKLHRHLRRRARARRSRARPASPGRRSGVRRRPRPLATGPYRPDGFSASIRIFLRTSGSPLSSSLPAGMSLASKMYAMRSAYSCALREPGALSGISLRDEKIS